MVSGRFGTSMCSYFGFKNIEFVEDFCCTTFLAANPADVMTHNLPKQTILKHLL